jgi:hypothetical protein
MTFKMLQELTQISQLHQQSVGYISEFLSEDGEILLENLASFKTWAEGFIGALKDQDKKAFDRFITAKLAHDKISADEAEDLNVKDGKDVIAKFAKTLAGLYYFKEAPGDLGKHPDDEHVDLSPSAIYARVNTGINNTDTALKRYGSQTVKKFQEIKTAVQNRNTGFLQKLLDDVVSYHNKASKTVPVAPARVN